ncbi:MAG: cytochrome c3 family protein [Deltaproteobacteria bacterium]|nr:cytochrome c3 family protein [Deltaproteobacteria bacterium]
MPAAAEKGEAPHLDERVLTRGCGTCHRGHGRSGTPMLMESTEETCLMCHGGVDPRMRDHIAPESLRRLKDLRPQFEAPYGHKLGTAEIHRRGEELPEVDPNLARHVTCLDCHDAHRTLRSPARLEGSNDQAPSTLKDEAFLHDVCLRCHGDSANLPVGARNIQSLLHPANRSYHPLLGPRRGIVDSPSLRAPWSTGGQLSCLDCHGSGDDRPGAHGSQNPSLLRETYHMVDAAGESELSYRLCYRCHARQSILADESFSMHRLHLTSPRAQTSCRTCHNAHGSREYDHLIEFDPMIVRPTRAGELEYDGTGGRQGTCRLTCHGFEHAPGRYCPPETPCDHGKVVEVGESSGAPRPFPADRPIVPDFGPGWGGAP